MIDLKKLAIDEFVTPPTKKNVGYFVVDSFIGTTFLTLKTFKESEDNILIYCANNFEVTEMYNSLTTFLDRDNIITIPNDELLRVEYLSESKEMVSQQIYGIYSLINAKHKIIILSPSSLYKFYPTKETFLSSCLHFKVGEKYDFSKVKSDLARSSYQRVSKIDQSLEYAVRGDIIDVFSLNYDNPIRIEFFDDEIESIRFFSIASQTSFEEIKEVDILPASLNLFTEKEKALAPVKLKERLKVDKENLSSLTYDELENQINEDIEDLKESNINSRFYKYTGCLQETNEDLLGFLTNPYKIIINNEDDFIRSRDNLFEEADNF
ncbi:MAG: hypothetical protein WCS51_04780, partial [Bacilli bacterium]